MKLLIRYTAPWVLLAASLAAAPLWAADFTAVADGDPDSRLESAIEPAMDPGKLAVEVLAANPGLASLEAAVREARARVEPAGALEDPSLSYQTAPRTFGSGNRMSHNVQFRQAIPWPGTLGLRQNAAGRRAEAAAHGLAAARLEVAALTHAAYAEWYFIHRALAINAANRALYDDLVAAAESLYAAGRVRQQDVLRAERERVHLKHQALIYQRQRNSIRAQINALLNRPARYPLPPPGDITAPAPVPDSGQLRQWAASEHPELHQLQARVNAQKRQAELARKAFYPNLELMTGYNNMWEATAMRWSVGVGINIPLDRGRRRAELDAARADQLRVQWQHTDRRAQLLAELDTVEAKVHESAHIVELYSERLVPLARETLNASLAAYRAGAGDFLAVSEAAGEVLRVELELVRSRSDYAIRLAELDRWTGGRLAVLPTPHAPSGGHLE